MRLKKFLILSISKTYSSSLQSGQLSKPSYKQLLSNYFIQALKKNFYSHIM